MGNKNPAQVAAVSLAIVAVIEAMICLVLFIPQSRAIKQINKQRQYVEEQVGRLEQTPEMFGKLQAQIGETRRLLSALKVFTGRPAQDIVMDAVGTASAPESVVVLRLAPEPPAENEEGGPSAESWRLRCRGSFRELTMFLNRIETQGVLLDGSDFEIDASKEEGIEMEVVLKTWRTAPAPQAASASDSEER